MKYIVTFSEFVTGYGHRATYTFDSGETDNFFTAEDYINSLDDVDLNHPDGEDGWTDVEIDFYADDADPMFDDPLRVERSGDTTC